MRIFKIKAFARWARDIKLSDSTLIKVIEEIGQGLYEANLGGHVYKKRAPIAGRGKRSGLRTIVAFKTNDKAIFFYGFPKNERANITPKEEDALKLLAKVYFEYSDKQINQALKIGELTEVNYEKIH